MSGPGLAHAGPLPADAAPVDERRQAVRNAAKLSLSLGITWSIGLGVRLLLPRHLGPALFGEFNFADAFAASFFVALGLGIEAHIHKTVSLRREYASSFVGVVLLLRLSMLLVLVPAMLLVLDATHRPATVRPLVWLFAASQFFAGTNATLSALLQARGRIDGLSAMNVASKVVWGLGLLAAALLHAELWGFVAPAVLSEAVKTPVLWSLARRHADLRLRLDWPAGLRAIGASFPFYASIAALTVFGKLDVSFLAVVGTSVEVGYYGAAQGIAAVALLATPIIVPVVFPLLVRAAARSEAEMAELVRRVLEITMVIAVPVSLAVALGADLWVAIVFGKAFAPAALALMVIAPTLLVTYVNMVCAVTLNALDRTWTVTLTTLAGIAMDAAFNATLLRPLTAAMGRPGAGAAACALALLAAELVVTGILLSVVGRKAFDRRNLTRIAKMAAAGLITIVVHLACVRWGAARLLLDAGVYTALVLGTKAVDLRELAAFKRELSVRS